MVDCHISFSFPFIIYLFFFLQDLVISEGVVEGCYGAKPSEIGWTFCIYL